VESLYSPESLVVIEYVTDIDYLVLIDLNILTDTIGSIRKSELDSYSLGRSDLDQVDMRAGFTSDPVICSSTYLLL
tara:strand:- start:368 stop:595 length:228 start_codon:yes stop_codon:yes gene_type:complete